LNDLRGQQNPFHSHGRATGADAQRLAAGPLPEIGMLAAGCRVQRILAQEFGVLRSLWRCIGYCIDWGTRTSVRDQPSTR